MPREDWSENALATELQMDRRTLSKRLEGLRPARTKRLKNREERFYRLSDVLKHLNRNARHSDAGNPLKEWTAKQLLPALLAGDFMFGVVGYLISDLGVDKVRAVRAHLDLALIAMTAMDDLAGEQLEYQIPEGIFRDAAEADSKGELEAFVAEHW